MLQPGPDSATASLLLPLQVPVVVETKPAGKGAPAEEKLELKVGENYPMKIIKLAPEERKIGLSIRALKSDEFRADWEQYQESAGDGTATLGDHFRNR